jgi:ketosteroid isomerase-like protein
MKYLLRTSIFTLSVTLATASVTYAQDTRPQDAQGEHKLKIKGDRVVIRDKSKPVRRALEGWYESNIAAFKAKDVEAVMRLRTEDFHTLTPDGKTNTRADMEAYTRRLLGAIDHFLAIEFQIGTIEVQGDLAYADVTQKTVRMQRLGDGGLRRVEAGAIQRETWKRTAEGWKLYRVDTIRDTGVLVDGKPYKSGQ